MPDVRESWRTERLNAAVYDAGVENERVARVCGRLMWSTDTRLMFKRIASLGDLPQGHAVLDVPCGGGLAFRGLKPGHGLRYVAADLSPYMLERAQRQATERGLDGIEFSEADALDLQFDDASFDLCISFNGLHCLPEQEPALKEMARVLRAGGELTGTAVVHGRGARQDAIIRGMRRISAFGETSTAEELRERLARAGFESVRVDASGALAHFSAQRPR